MKITNEMVRQSLAEQYDEEVLNAMSMFETPCFAAAIVGVTHDNRLVYDYDKMVQCLVEEDGMEEEEAVEFIDYNTIRTLPYMENAPVIYMPLLMFNAEE